MRNFFMIFKNGIKQNRVLIPGVVAMVAVLMICFSGGRAAGAKFAVTRVDIGVIDLDKSELSADCIRYMEEKLSYKVTEPEEGLSYEDAFRKLTGAMIDRRISLIVEIPAGFESSVLSGEAPALAMTILDDYANEAYAKSYLSSYMERTMLLSQVADGDAKKLQTLLKEAQEEELSIALQDGSTQDLQVKMDAEGISMMMGFFSFIGFGYPMFLGMLVFESKKNGTFKRVQISSIKPAAYIGGMALSNLVISALIVLGVCIMLFVYKAVNIVPLPLLAFLMLLFIVYSIGFNLMAAFLVKSNFTYMTIGVAYISISNILGGAYFPLGENVLAKFSVLTPQYFILNTVRGLAEDATYRYDTNISILLLMTVLVYLVAAVVYTKRE